MDIRTRLNKFDIDPDSELGKHLIKLDDIYQSIEDTQKKIDYYTDKKIQFQEDLEVMELLLMHKFNKDARIQKWGSNE